MTRLFTLAIFFSATLLFMVQPLAGKILLPVLGGSPAVWSTCIVFFQALLLLGYLYAHALSTLVPPRWQCVAHIGVLVAASVALPLPIEIGEPGGADPPCGCFGRWRDSRPAVPGPLGYGPAPSTVVFENGRSAG